MDTSYMDHMAHRAYAMIGRKATKADLFAAVALLVQEAEGRIPTEAEEAALVLLYHQHTTTPTPLVRPRREAPMSRWEWLRTALVPNQPSHRKWMERVYIQRGWAYATNNASLHAISVGSGEEDGAYNASGRRTGPGVAAPDLAAGIPDVHRVPVDATVPVYESFTVSQVLACLQYCGPIADYLGDTVRLGQGAKPRLNATLFHKALLHFRGTVDAVVHVPVESNEAVVLATASATAVILPYRE